MVVRRRRGEFRLAPEARLDHPARNDDLLAKLYISEWDLVIGDEAHKMAAHLCGTGVNNTKRCQLGEGAVRGGHIGEHRLGALFDRYRRETVEMAAEEIFRQSEQLDREAIRAIPDGTYTAEGFLDSDGVGDDPIHVKVKITVEGERLVFDLTETDGPRVPMPLPNAIVHSPNAKFNSTVSTRQHQFSCASLARNETPRTS